MAYNMITALLILSNEFFLLLKLLRCSM